MKRRPFTSMDYAMAYRKVIMPHFQKPEPKRRLGTFATFLVAGLVPAIVGFYSLFR